MTHKYKIGDCFISNDLWDEHRVPLWITETRPDGSYVLESTEAIIDMTLYIDEEHLEQEYDRRSDHDKNPTPR